MADLRPYPKLICRAPVDPLRHYVPQEILEKVRDSPQYRRGSDAVVTTSDRTTSANANRQDCIEKFHDILRNIAKGLITEASRKPPNQLYVVPPEQDYSSLTPISGSNRLQTSYVHGQQRDALRSERSCSGQSKVLVLLLVHVRRI